MSIGGDEEVDIQTRKHCSLIIEKPPICCLMMSFGVYLGLGGHVWLTLGRAREP